MERVRVARAAAGRPAMTFAAATDGNHGRAVAWAAQQLGQKAKVYMPKGTAAARVKVEAG